MSDTKIINDVKEDFLPICKGCPYIDVITNINKLCTDNIVSSIVLTLSCRYKEHCEYVHNNK